MVAIFEQKTEEIKEYIEEETKKTSIGQLDDNFESLGVDVKLGSWLKNDTTMLNYAQLFMKESPSFLESIKMQFLELKLSITCEYFKDFKDFLGELKEGEQVDEDSEDNNSSDQNTTKNISYDDNSEFEGIKVSEVKSQPFYKNPDSGVTRCSATARYNGSDFGLTLPSGNAYVAGRKPADISEYKATIPSSKQNKKPNNSWSKLDISNFPKGSDDINFADIYTSSGSKYGHRATAFKDSTGQWYILDPYTRVNGKIDGSPKKLEDYMKKRKVVKTHLYNSPGYSPEKRNYA